MTMIRYRQALECPQWDRCIASTFRIRNTCVITAGCVQISLDEVMGHERWMER